MRSSWSRTSIATSSSSPARRSREIIPGAVDEVGGPTILATLTVIAALLPMAFVSRADGALHEPDPDQREHGHAALARDRVHRHAVAARLLAEAARAPRARARRPQRLAARLAPLFERMFAPVARRSARPRATARLLGVGVAAADRASRWRCRSLGLVRAEDAAVRQQVGVPGRRRHAGRHAASRRPPRCCASSAPTSARVPEVTDYQAYAGTAAPINFNGLVRQYYLRAGGDVGDLQVNLVDKHERSEQSHAIATRVRPALQQIGAPLRRQRQGRRGAAGAAGAVARSSRRSTGRRRGPAARSRRRVRAVFEQRPRTWSTSTTAASRPRAEDACCWSTVARPRCSACRSSRSSSTLRAGLGRRARDLPARRRANTRAAATLQLPAERQGDLDTLLQLRVRSRRRQAGADPRTGHA